MRHGFELKKRPDSPNWCWNAQINGLRARGTTSLPNEKEHEAAACREAAAAWLAECARRGAPIDPESAGVDLDTLSLVSRFVDEALPARAKKRNARYAEQLESALLQYVVDRFPVLSQLTGAAWARWMDEVHSNALDPKKLRTIQTITSAANVFLDFCVAQGLLRERPTLPRPAAEEVAGETADRRAFTRKERDAFLVAVKKLDARAHRIYTVLLYTGLRKSGLERMQDRWIDRSTSYVTFPARALKDGRRSRTFWLRPEALAAIDIELATYGKATPMVVFGPFDYDGHGRKVSGEKKGLFWEAVRLAGIKDTHGLTAHHVTRHTACTIAGNEGATLAQLMALGGWTTPACAMRYFHIDAEQAKLAAERL